MDKLDKFGKIDESNIDIILEEVEEFLQLYLFKGNVSLNNRTIEDLFELSSDDLTTLKAVHFMLSNQVRDLVKILPQLVRNLAHSTQKETEIMRGNIRGRVDWGATLKERYSQGFNDKSLFVCNPPSKYYDLEENQLLKFILKRIIHLYKNYLNFISPETFDIEKIDKNKDWYTIVNDNAQMARLTLRKVYFNDIADVKIRSKHLRKCMKNRNLLYHYVAKVYRLYEELFVLEDENVLKDLLSQRIIKTADGDKLYEIYIFFNLVRSLPGFWEGKLLYSGNDYSTTCELDDLKITVHYQKTPDALKEVSEYLDIIGNYEIKGSTRSPDVIIEFVKDGETFFRLVEVKNSSSEGYVRSSLYKVMGYYKDFRKVCTLEDFDFTEKYPVVLVTWGGISLKEGYNPFNDDIIILNRKEFIINLDKLINPN
ncbi:MAG: hypothetical protein IKV87_00315 [Methanobrevibacter sp.]|nr:hypothetical protein [Methanobrevibacter sp.]